jgi:hypothetical protein
MTYEELAQKYAAALVTIESLEVALEGLRGSASPPIDGDAVRASERRRADMLIQTWRDSNAALLAKLMEERKAATALTEQNNQLTRRNTDLSNKNDRAGVKVNALLKALRYYANPDNYNSWSRPAVLRDRALFPFVSDDKGAKAREAIKLVESQEG